MSDYDHWLCPRCDSVDGPITGVWCDLCAEESTDSAVIGLVPIDELKHLRRAVRDAHARIMDAEDPATAAAILDAALNAEDPA